MFDAFSLYTYKDLSALYDPALSMSLCIFIIICCRMCSFSCLSFSFILFCVFSLDIFDTDFWSSCLIVSREVASFMEKLKFTALATRASRTSINYTRVFNRWRSFSADVLVIFSSGFWSSGSSDDCQVNKLKQKLKLTVLAPRASETSENYLKAFNRWAEFLLSCQSHGLCPLSAVSSTVIKVGVCHQLRFLRFQVAASGWRSGFSYLTSHRYLREEGSSSSC